MKDEKLKSRRDFLKNTLRYVSAGTLGVLGVSLSYDSLTSDKTQTCEVNLPCRNCFKLGNCSEDKAVNMRKEIHSNSSKNKEVGNV